MARFRIDSIATLSRELLFTPNETRAAQLISTEALLYEIEPNKAYPLELVVFRITGYRPREMDTKLLTGLALQHDLGLLIEQVSNSLSVRVDSLREPVLTIEQVSARFNVTTKTIQRWRRRGLAARRFIFSDGKRRVGFLVSHVERFITCHSDQTSRVGNFSQVDSAEQAAVLSRARRLAVECGCCADEIARRIGRKLRRSPLTIAGLIRDHDRAFPDDAILPLAAQPMDDDERAHLIRQYRRGVSLSLLARRAKRRRSSIYRAILDDRVARLLRRKVKFIDDPLYHDADAERSIAAIVHQEELGRAGSVEETRVPAGVPPWLADLYRTPLLSPAGERALFLRLNFHKYQFVVARRRLEPDFVRGRDVLRLEHHRRQIVAARNAIVRANLRLVVSVARKHLRPALNLTELLSDGSLTLMRAIDSFDAHRGNRFSTYATLALMKGFARSVPQMLAGRAAGVADMVAADGEPISVLNAIADPRTVQSHDRLMAREQVHSMLSRLNHQEQQILDAHFGLRGGEASTYQQISTLLGLPQRRIRQIERRALAKLRNDSAEN